MPQDRGIPNRKENKTEAGKELNTRLPKHLPDQALPLAARSPIHVGMPPLISYIRQQSRHLGESSSRLTRWVLGRDGLASTVSRALSLPLFSRAFDYIRRKATFVPPVWPRTLDLPWFQRGRERRRSFTKTTDTVADRQLNTISLPPDELYPDMLLQTLSDATEEERPVRPADEAYPALIKNLISPSVAGERPSATTHEFPHHAGEPAQPLPVSRKERPARPADEAYPALIKNLISPSVAGKRPSATTREFPHHAGAASRPPSTKQPIDSRETEGSSESVPSNVGQSSIPVPGAYRAYQTPEPDRTQARGAEDRPTQVSWQRQYTYLKQGLSRVLKAITQRMTLKRRPVEALPHVTEEDISESPASPIRYYYPKAIEAEVESGSAAANQPILPFMTTISKISTLHRATVKVIHPLRKLAGSKQPAMLKRESLLHTLTVPRRPAFIREESERPESSAIPRTVDGITKAMPDSLPSETRTYRESTEVLPSGVAPRQESRAGQFQQRAPLIGLSLNRIRKKLETIYTAKDMIIGTLRPAMANLGPPPYGIIHPVFKKGHTGEPLSYLGSSSVAGPDVQQSPVPESIQHKMISLTPKFFKPTDYTSLPDNTENYRFLPGQESLAFSPDYKYTRKEALEMPSVSSVQPKRDFSVASEEELITNMPNIIPEPVYPRKQRAPELPLAPLSYTAVTASSQIARASLPEPPATAEGGESVAKIDIDDIANNIYRILKWRLSVERERALGVF